MSADRATRGPIRARGRGRAALVPSRRRVDPRASPRTRGYRAGGRTRPRAAASGARAEPKDPATTRPPRPIQRSRVMDGRPVGVVIAVTGARGAFQVAFQVRLGDDDPLLCFLPRASLVTPEPRHSRSRRRRRPGRSAAAHPPVRARVPTRSPRGARPRARPFPRPPRRRVWDARTDPARAIGQVVRFFAESSPVLGRPDASGGGGSAPPRAMDRARQFAAFVPDLVLERLASDPAAPRPRARTPSSPRSSS